MPQGDVTNPNLPACSSRICRQTQGVPQGGCASRLHQKKTTTDRRRRLRGAQSGVRPNSTCAMISGICVPSFAVLHPPSGWMQHRMGPPVWCFLSYSAVCVCRCAGNNRYGFAPILPQDGQNGSSLAAGFILYFCISCHETGFQLQSGKMPVAVSVAETRLAQRAETGRTRRTGRLAFVRNGAGANEDIAALAAAPVVPVKSTLASTPSTNRPNWRTACLGTSASPRETKLPIDGRANAANFRFPMPFTKPGQTCGRTELSGAGESDTIR